MATTQDNRLMQILTPLGKDFLMINRVSGTEEISSLFSYDVELVHEEEPGVLESTIVSADSILGQAVAIKIDQQDGTTRMLRGMINRFSQGHRDNRFSYYYATIVPDVWLLTQISQSRIFQQKSVPDILKTVFTGLVVKYQLQATYEPRNYCVQYRESDFDFASRLMEDEGIYYFFEHQDDRLQLVIADTPQSHPDCPSKSTVPYYVNTGDNLDMVAAVVKWRTSYNLQSGKVSFADHNFQLPAKRLETSKPSVFKIANNQNLEIYDFPGGYAKKYDGIDKGGGEQASELNKVFQDNIKKSNSVMQSLDANYKVIQGESDCSSFTAGHRFKLVNHPNADQNNQYVLTSIALEMEQSPTYISGEPVAQNYLNTFSCILYGASSPPFRPMAKTKKPVIQGSQTAYVVGPAGEEIFTDKYGRVKIQLHWDRNNAADAGSSCWVRVAQAWAGNKWGMMFIPRIGMEVIVHFMEGDPDQPIITGCVYNPSAMPPYTLPDDKTKMTIKSNSTKGGGGYNELRFEDKKGSEQIFIHGEKNMDVRVENDSIAFTGRDHHLTINNNQHEKVLKDKHTKVIGDKNEAVDGSMSVKVGVDVDKKVGSKYAVDSGMEIHMKAGMNLTLEAGTSLTLKVGGNFININSGGIFIKGTMVMLNSGGAAGSGSGANPDPPAPPIDVDKATAGISTAVPTARTWTPPPIESPAAMVMINAAQNGTPFCEICQR